MAFGMASHSALERPVMAITSELLYGDMVIDTGTERQQGLVSSHAPLPLHDAHLAVLSWASMLPASCPPSAPLSYRLLTQPVPNQWCHCTA